MKLGSSDAPVQSLAFHSFLKDLPRKLVEKIPLTVKKTTAYRIFIPFGVASLAWTVWCLRPVLWGTSFTFPGEVPLKAQRSVKENYPRRKVTAGYLAELFREPFEERMAHVEFKYKRNPWPSDPVTPWTHFVFITDGIIFEFTDENWDFKQSYACCGPPR